jgi:hypothetical protein
VARRQARLIVGGGGYFIFLTILPFVFGALSLIVPGHTGLRRAGEGSDEAVEILVMLNFAAVFMGTALTIRGVVAERRVFVREHSVGLSVPGYLAARIVVFSLVLSTQTAVLTTIVVLGKGAPAHGSVLTGEPIVELFLTLVTTAIVSAIVGLALSALAKYKREILPIFTLAIVLSLVFSGGMFPLTDRFGVNQISWFIPSQWGFAAAASTVDLRATGLLATHGELWTHSPRWWVFDIAVLIISGAVCAGFLSWRLRRLTRTPRRHPAKASDMTHR